MIGLVRDWLLDPLGLLLVWTVLLWLVARRSSKRLPARPIIGALWFAGLAFLSAPAVVNPLVASLEGRVPDGSCPSGTLIVVLGGGIDGRSAESTRYEAMSSSTLARVAEGGRLALAEPGQQVVVSGGAIGLLTEADVMASLLQRLGVDAGRIVRERRSMSTAQNARELARLLPEGEQRLRLVTSALHMPRAMGALRSAGLDPCAVPVDRIARVDVPLWALWPQTTALVKFDRWFHERIALVLYRLNGSLDPSLDQAS